MFKKLIATTQSWTPIALRLSMGLLFVMHGAEKVFGIHGGPGLNAWIAEERSTAGLRPAWLWLGAAALFELIGGVLMVVGFLTRLGALMVMPVMLVALYGVMSNAGAATIPLPRIGYPLAMLGAAIALFISGGGRASIDSMLGKSRRR